jgi:hypothetical protein
MSSENSDIKGDDKISKSPDRHSFQRNGYVKRQEEKGESLNEDYLDLFDKILEQEKYKFDDPASRVNNMEYDLLTTEWILAKARASNSYAQNMYAAMCNMRFVRRDMFPYLRQDPDKDLWSASWRAAGGIVADMLGKGDYIDWYCSGMGGLNREFDGDETNEQWQKRTGYVPESVITDEIRDDLLRLGWIPVPWDDDNSK